MHRFGDGPVRSYAKEHQDVHCAIIVTLDNQDYLVDLVWGNAFRKPLLVNGDVLSMPGEPDRKCEYSDNHYTLYACIKGNWEAEYELVKEDKPLDFFKQQIEFLCSEKHHLSHEMLFMRVEPKKAFSYAWKVVFDPNNANNTPAQKGEKPELAVYKKQPSSHVKTLTIFYNQRQDALLELKNFGTSDDNANTLLDHCGFSK